LVMPHKHGQPKHGSVADLPGLAGNLPKIQAFGAAADRPRTREEVF